MSREIKFRGIRLDNGEWVYGYYSKSTPVFEGVEHSYITPICENGSIDMSRKVDPETVGQFVVLEKDSPSAYEGDIIRVIDDCGDEYITTVEYDSGAFVVDVEGHDFDITSLGWAIQIWENENSQWEVIGNKWDNPELLEKPCS